MSIEETLAERGQRYGEFVDHASVTQAIKAAMATGENWEFSLDDDQKECLEMIAHKVGRILNGDPDYIDSWTDIIGYTRLVEKRLIEGQSAKEPTLKQMEIEKARAAIYESMKSAGVAIKAQCTCPKCRPDVHGALDLLLKAGVIKQSE